MIDTICLLIPKEKMSFVAGVSDWEFSSNFYQDKKFVCNPTNLETKTGNYYPRLTSYQKGFFKSANVKIEFSAPKLLFLNNLDELENEDFSKVVEVLQERLKDMGLLISETILRNASACSVHFSKNILLTGGYTSNYLISEIGKVDLRKTFDFAKTRFINDGQSLYAHTNSHQLVIYDKVADLRKGKNKAIDKNKTLYEKNLIVKLKKESQKEIIRFEVRLVHKRKLNQILEQLGYQKNPNFEDVFSSEMSKKILNNYWRKIIKDRNLGVFTTALSLKDTLRAIFLSDKKIKPKHAIYLLGLSLVSRDRKGMRELRTIISERSHDRTWYRMIKDIRQVNELISKTKLKDWVKQIDKGLEDYKPYKIKSR